jgi:hypothetical protein
MELVLQLSIFFLILIRNVLLDLSPEYLISRQISTVIKQIARLIALESNIISCGITSFLEL